MTSRLDDDRLQCEFCDKHCDKLNKDLICDECLKSQKNNNL
jgi:hypothetical protein